MILLFIFGISIIQFGVYFLIDKYKINLPNFLILLIILIGYFFAFPRLFYPEPRTDRINCGIPLLGITLGFWIFGTIAGVATQMIWKLKTRKNKSTKHNK